MKQKALFTTFLFFLPVLQRFITAKPFYLAIANLKYEVMVILGLIALLFIVRIATVIYFCVSFFNWVNSGFSFKKLLPFILSIIAIFCLDYSIKAIVINSSKKIKNKIQKIPNALIQLNRQALQNIHF